MRNLAGRWSMRAGRGRLGAAAALALSLLAAWPCLDPGARLAAAPSAGSPAGRLVLVVAPDLGWDDVAAPELRSFALRTAWTNVNVRGGTNTRASSYATLSAGTASVGASLDAGYAVGDMTPEGPAVDVFVRRMGGPPPAGAVLQLDMAAVHRLNATDVAAPGALGDALHQARLATAVWGNADSPGLPERGAVLLLSDSKGVVDQGRVSAATLAPDQTAPFGRVASLPDFLRWWDTLAPAGQGGPAVVAVEFGDFWRQQMYATDVRPEVAMAERAAARAALAGFLRTITHGLDPGRDGILLLSPVARTTSHVSDYLTPMGLWGRGAQPGLLRSGSTRRPGLVTAGDVAPTVLRWLGLPIPVGMRGRPAEVIPLWDAATLNEQATPVPAPSEETGGGSASEAVPAPAALPALVAVASSVEIHDRTLSIDRLRPDIIKGWIIAYLIAVAAAGVRLVTARKPLGSLALVLAYLAALGPGFLLATASPWPPWSGLAAGFLDVALAALLLALVSAWLGRRLWGRPEGTLFALAIITSLLLTLDASRGGFWTRWSYLGYSALSGARYYGIGNELMGVWIGAVLVAMVGILDVAPRRGLLAVAGLMAACAFLLAWPGGGANFGGATGAVIAFVPAFIAAARGRLLARDLLWAAAGFVGVVALMVGLDLSLGAGHMSHVGRLAEEVRASGPGSLIDIAVHKLELEWHLILLTIWTKLLAVSVASAAMVLLWSPEPLQRLWTGRPPLRAGAIGFGLGTLSVLALNDSGVVAAATMLTMVAAAFFASVSEELARGRVG